MPQSAPGLEVTRREPGDHHGFLGNNERNVGTGAINGLANEIVNRRGAIQNCSAAQNGAALHNRSLIHAAISTDQHFIFNDHRQRADRLQHAADL